MTHIKLHIFLFLLLLLSSCLPVAQTKQVIKPYSIQSTFNKLKKDYPFISPIKSSNNEFISKQENIVYKSLDKSDLMFDMYSPTNSNQTLPAVLLIHGGGWMNGSRDNLRIMAQDLAKNGYVGIAISYRLGKEATYPTAVNDIRDALAFIRKKAGVFQIDPNKIAILGTSAGAHLATLAGVTSNTKLNKTENAKQSNEVQAIISIDGAVSFIHPNAEEGCMASTWFDGDKADNFEDWKEASPLEYVGEKTPPTLFINSSEPRFHAYRNEMVQILNDYKIYNEIHTLPGSPHAFWLLNPWYETSLKLILNFLNKLFYPQNTYANGPYRTINVAQDGSGEFTNIQSAINSIRDLGPSEVIIYVANGIYNEKIEIPSWKHHVSIIGEDREHTIISNADHSGMIDALSGKALSTFTSYTMLVRGDDIKIDNITIENTSCGNGQAVALHIEGDRFIMTNSKLKGCQDTLYTANESNRQYFYNTYIQGTTDFIFGEATAVFQYCNIHSLQDSYITAAATPSTVNYGYVFIDCVLTAEDGVKEVFLGRPWRPFAKTVFINTLMGDHILPEGWNSWDGDEMFPNKDKTVYYAEYKSRGEGGSSMARVSWSHQLTDEDIKFYNLFHIFNGWAPMIPEFNIN